jgi:hypothetical protein
MRVLILGLTLMLGACCTPKGGAPKIGKAEPGKTRVQCKDMRVVDDPAKCAQPK